MCRNKICLIILIALGVTLLLTYSLIFNCALSLKCSVFLYKAWKDVPDYVQTEIYLFNWTNPKDIKNSSIKLKFKEIGPFMYLEKDHKANVVFNDNGTITYNQVKFWHYDTSRPNLNLEQNITSVNPQLLGLSYLTRFWNYYVRRGAFITFSSIFSQLESTHTAREILFDGYHIPFVGIIRRTPFSKLLTLPPWDEFGWIYKRNGSAEFEGTFNIGSGDNTVLGKLYRWNYQNETQFYNDECNKISGSAGHFFPRKLNRKSVDIFSTDVSRTISLKFEKEERVNGIVGYKYHADNYMFDNGTLNSKNKCFCTGECTPSGLVNISASRYNAPVFASLPHFYGADPYYNQLIDGLKPEKAKHDSYMILEPETGIVLEVNVKLQVNLLLQPISGIPLLDDVPKVYVPVFWIKDKFTISSNKAFLVKLLLLLPTTSITFGVLLIVMSTISLLIMYRNSQRKQKPRDKIKFHKIML